jgi:hypothetical protein
MQSMQYHSARSLYCGNIIVEAKQRFLDDVSNSKLSTTDKLPHFPKRRDGVNRSAREVDDITSIVDEQGLSNSLPSYVGRTVSGLLWLGP